MQDAKHMQRMQSQDTIHYLLDVLNGEPGLEIKLSWDLSPKLQIWIHSFAAYQRCRTTTAIYMLQLVDLFETDALKIHAFVDSFMACQRYNNTFESSMSQTRRVYLFATDALTIRVRIRHLQLKKHSELPPQS